MVAVQDPADGEGRGLDTTDVILQTWNTGWILNAARGFSLTAAGLTGFGPRNCDWSFQEVL